VMSTGVLIGNIDVRSFVIHEGGIFQGSSIMNMTAQVSDLAGSSNVVDAKSHKQKNEQPAAAAGG
jgi:cytoskeletal protein CcmA (bactofilin family)